jgi:2-polyprenyl-6-methoxyphenol hydroxylase-like FAD-dependent oxidoreductase
LRDATLARGPDAASQPLGHKAHCGQILMSSAGDGPLARLDSDLDFPDADLIVAADGVNSKIRTKYAETFRPDILLRPNPYIWLGTNKRFDAFTFDFRKIEHGWFQAHVYKFEEGAATFIVRIGDPPNMKSEHGAMKLSALPKNARPTVVSAAARKITLLLSAHVVAAPVAGG